MGYEVWVFNGKNRRQVYWSLNQTEAVQYAEMCRLLHGAVYGVEIISNGIVLNV